MPQLDSLTMLRGVAATAVVHTHCLRLYETITGAPAPLPAGWLDVGQFAVFVFFALSGLTLALAHRDDRWDGRGWTRFLLRRWFRVMPGFAASFLVCWAVVAIVQAAGVLLPRTWLADTNRLPDVGSAVAILSFTANWFGVTDTVNTVFWSMPIEFQFYLLFPLLLIGLRRSAWLVAAATAGLGLLDHRAGWRDQTLSLVWLFAAGMASAHRLPRAATGGAVAVAAAVLAGVISNLPAATLLLLPGPVWLYFGVLAWAVVWGTAPLRAGHLRPAWLRGFLRHLGDISYSLYLFHTPVLFAAYCLLRGAGRGGVTLLLIDALVLPASWAAATIAWRALERPGIAAGRRLASHPILASP